jgi:hypothetical protein
MTEVALHPIVIGAIVSGPFECLGDGLLHEGVEREQPNTLKDLLVPTKSSKRSAIEDRERPKKWWKGMLLCYYIPGDSLTDDQLYLICSAMSTLWTSSSCIGVHKYVSSSSGECYSTAWRSETAAGARGFRVRAKR